jgi:hypothetical protein
MKISADEETLFLGDHAGRLKLMSLTDGTIIKDWGKIHDGRMTGIVKTADEKFLFTSSSSGILKQWNYGEKTLVRDH